jgi:hypothetical protein
MAPLMRGDFVAQPSLVTDEYAIDDLDILVDVSTGLPMTRWSNQGTVINKVDVRYNWNEEAHRNDFGIRQLFSGEDSVTRYGVQPALTMDCRGIHTALVGQAILNRFAVIYLQRWGYPPPILTCTVTYRRHLFQALETLRVSHSKIPNCITGELGLTNERFEVISVNARWGIQGGLDLVLLWIGAIETSSVPVPSDALELEPGATTVDATDVNVPFASSATVATPVACNQIRLGLKGLNYRVWRLHYNVWGLQQGPKVPDCEAQGVSFDSRLYNTRITYHIDYKTTPAPDAPGTPGDPTTGWIAFVGSSVRGNTSFVSAGGCGASPPSAPGEDVWTEFRADILPAAPAFYNIRVYFDGITAQGDPHPAPHLDCGHGGSGACADIYTSSQLFTEQLRLTINYIEGIV